ncbi:Bromodomain [Trinorchestia longiramus]|nr:Bromodomain [Trinorchestia longiramus]
MKYNNHLSLFLIFAHDTDVCKKLRLSTAPSNMAAPAAYEDYNGSEEEDDNLQELGAEGEDDEEDEEEDDEDEDDDDEDQEVEDDEEEEEDGFDEQLELGVTPPKKTNNMYSGLNDIVSSGSPGTFSSLRPSFSNNLDHCSPRSSGYSSAVGGIQLVSRSVSGASVSTSSSDAGVPCSSTPGGPSTDEQGFYGDDFSDDDGASQTSPLISGTDISTHIKGSLSFGLPKKLVMKSRQITAGFASRTIVPAGVVNRFTTTGTNRVYSPATPKALTNRPKLVFKRAVGRPLKAAIASSILSNGSGAAAEVTASSGGLMVHRPVVSRKKEAVNIDHLSEELQQGYKIVCELMSDHHRTSNTVYMDELDLDPVRNREYLEVIQKPMWLKKIHEQLLKEEYTNITAVVADIRLMLENAYRFYGPLHSFTKKGLRLEHVLEQKIALLPKEMRELCCLERTSGQPVEPIKETHRNKTAKISVNDLSVSIHIPVSPFRPQFQHADPPVSARRPPSFSTQTPLHLTLLYSCAGDNFFSHVLHRVKGCRAAREKELKKRRQEALRQAKHSKELEVVCWDEQLMAQNNGALLTTMWELPAIGHFIYLTLNCLNISEVSQYELERILLLPQVCP